MIADREILTVGHSTHAIDRFVELLQRHRVELLVDVRRWPTSRKHPQFSRETLAEALQEAGIEYAWLGDDLGGYRSGGYEAYTTTPEFERGLNKLMTLATGKRTAVMCAEGLFFKCHRRFISDRLVNEGWKVVHIYPDGRVSIHRQRDLFSEDPAGGLDDS